MANVNIDDAAKLTSGLFILTTAALVLIHLSPHYRLLQSLKVAIAVGLRFAYVYVIGVLILYWPLGLSANVVLIVAGVVFLLGLLARFEFEAGFGVPAIVGFLPGGGVLAIAMALLVMFPIWMVKQFVLGFPDREKIVLPSYSKIDRLAKPRPPVPAVGELPDEPVTVVSMLRPMGKVAWRDRHFEAISGDGKMVEVGTKVLVRELRDQMFVVLPIADELPAANVETEKES